MKRDIDIKKPEDPEISCTVCNTKNYRPWKCLGPPDDTESRVIKLMLPFLFCEKCYRKRFCQQGSDLCVCGVAVFVPNEDVVYCASI